MDLTATKQPTPAVVSVLKSNTLYKPTIYKTSLLILFVFSRLFVCAQADTAAPYVYKDFITYKAFLQVSVGTNVPVGAYGNDKTPFKSSYASGVLANGSICISAKYAKKIKNRFGFEVGVGFFRNRFNYKDFKDSYLRNMGDTVKDGNYFLYEHLTLGGGGNYSIGNENFLLSTYLGAGVLYTKSLGKYGEGEGLQISRATGNNSNYGGGGVYIPKSYMPMFYSGVSVKYNLGDEFFLVGNCDFVYSFYRFELTERAGLGRPETTYLKRNLTITNLSFSIGVGTMF